MGGEYSGEWVVYGGWGEEVREWLAMVRGGKGKGYGVWSVVVDRVFCASIWL